MKLSRIFLLLVFSLNTLISVAQVPLPSYVAVVNNFFSTYSHETEEPNDRLFFARKRDGWYIQIIDQLNNDAVKNEQLFWSQAADTFKPLTGFGPGLDNEEAEEKITDVLGNMDGPFLYGFNRCRYFGYNEWDADMIKDFGEKEIAEDTLLEGLGRAYSNYAERYLWSTLGGTTYDNDPLKSKLDLSQLPGRERIGKFIFYINKSIECYAKLDRLNPGYKMLVGNPKTKLLNEQFHAYQQLLAAGYKIEAQQFLDKVPGDDSLYTGIGYAYLSSCPPNSILITFGDNDTYPLWYVQQKKGFRKDVTVINNSLMSLIPYINMLKKDPALHFTTNPVFLKKHGQGYFPYDAKGTANIIKLPLAQFIRDIHQSRHPLPAYTGTDTLSAYQVKIIELTIDLPRLKKICNQSNLTTIIRVELKNYLLLNDLLTLDIVNSNLYTRPICFTSLPDLFAAKYLQQESNIYRLLPLDEKRKAITENIEALKAENYLGKNDTVVLARFTDTETYYEDALYGRHGMLFAKVIDYYSGKKMTAKAEEWASRYTALTSPLNIRYTISETGIASSLLKTSFHQQGVAIIENIATHLVKDYQVRDRYPFLFEKESYVGWLTYLDTILSTNNRSSEKLKKLIEDFEEED